MDLYSIKTIKELLQAHNTVPKNRMGQNFLLERKVAIKMLRAAELSFKDTALEVGAGIGTLTKELAQKAKRVIAVEKDPIMVEILKETTKALPNIKIIQEDILNLISLSYPQLNEIKDGKYKVVANLPYYITSPAIRMFLEADKKPKLMVFMVQKEVAQRICAKPPKMNLLALSVQFYAEAKIISSVRKGAFWPRPKVDSAIVKLIPHRKKPRVSPARFFRVVKAGFKQPRKQLGNNFSQQLKLSRQKMETWLAQVNIAPAQRAETLSLTDWVTLAKSLPKT